MECLCKEWNCRARQCRQCAVPPNGVSALSRHVLSACLPAGFGKEMFTDAGKYAIHFGSSAAEAAEQLSTAVQAAHPDKPPPDVTALARLRNDLSVIPTSTGALWLGDSQRSLGRCQGPADGAGVCAAACCTHRAKHLAAPAGAGNQLVVNRPLQLDERMVALAAAISIDYGEGVLLACRRLPPHVGCAAAALQQPTAPTHRPHPTSFNPALPCTCRRLLLPPLHPGRHPPSIPVPAHDPIPK